MADGLFLFQFHLGEGAGLAVGYKERVVAEAHVAYGGVVDGPAAFPFKDARLADAELAVDLRNDLVRKKLSYLCSFG